MSPTIEKRSDNNHLKKILGNELYGIKQQHKLSVKTIKYIQKMFNYMLSQNNTTGIVNGLTALSKHMFDEHANCDVSWCRHIDEQSRKFKSLPYGKPLTSQPLKLKLTEIFDKNKKQADKLACLNQHRLTKILIKLWQAKLAKITT